MNFSRRYAEVVYPAQTRVLGLKLRPLTIAHALLLWRIGSPFLAAGDVGVVELTAAMYVLSRPCAAAAAGLQKGRTAYLLKVWAAQLWCRKDAIAKGQEQINEHIEDAFSGPKLWELEGKLKNGAPYLQWLKCSLMECLNVTREQALNYQVREAIWDIACYAETHGRADWVSSSDEEDIKRLTGN